MGLECSLDDDPPGMMSLSLLDLGTVQDHRTCPKVWSIICSKYVSSMTAPNLARVSLVTWLERIGCLTHP